MVNICYHHTDHDGLCAAAIVGAEKNIKLGYSTKITASDILNTCSGQVVAMVDFSLEINRMRQIQEVAKDFIWIDHHESARPCTSLGLRGIFSVEKAGCELTWDFFNPKKPPPDVVKYVGDRDIWKFSYPETKIYGFGLNVTEGLDDPLSAVWVRLLSTNDFTSKILEAGEIASKVVYSDIEWIERLNLYRVGKIFIINASSNVSELASAIIDKNGEDCLVMIWQLAKKGLRISFRGHGAGETAENLSKSLGVRGGGHSRASGLSLPITHPMMWSMLQDLYKNAQPI